MCSTRVLATFGCRYIGPVLQRCFACNFRGRNRAARAHVQCDSEFDLCNIASGVVSSLTPNFSFIGPAVSQLQQDNTFWHPWRGTCHAPCWPITWEKSMSIIIMSLHGAIRWRRPLVNRMRGSKDISFCPASRSGPAGSAAYMWEKSGIQWGLARASRSLVINTNVT